MSTTQRRLDSNVHHGQYQTVSARTQPRTLVELCQNCLYIWIDAVADIGDTPKHLLMPVFTRISPHQLRRLEDINPQLVAETDDLWKVHCIRDFTPIREAVAQHKPVLKRGQTWRQLYELKQEEVDAKKAQLGQRLKNSYKQLQEQKEARAAKFLDRAPRAHSRTLSQQRKLSGNPIIHKARTEARKSAAHFHATKARPHIKDTASLQLPDPPYKPPSPSFRYTTLSSQQYDFLSTKSAKSSSDLYEHKRKRPSEAIDPVSQFFHELNPSTTDESSMHPHKRSAVR